MLKQRIVTGVFLAAVFFCCLFLVPKPGFIWFLAAVIAAGVWEWSNLSGITTSWQRMLYCLLTLGVVLLAAYYLGWFDSGLRIAAVRQLLVIAGVWWAVALLWIQGYPSSAILWGSHWVRLVMGWLVLIPAGFALVYLYFLPHGSWLILLLILIVMVADSGAYFVGKAFGSHKLASQVSPGKTWEGFAGGLLSCIALAILVGVITDFDHWFALLTVLIFTALASVVGDLLESMLKRHRGIKDSSHLLPGHGGVLDRLDSISAAAPIFVLGLILSGWQI